MAAKADNGTPTTSPVKKYLYAVLAWNEATEEVLLDTKVWAESDEALRWQIIRDNPNLQPGSAKITINRVVGQDFR